MTSTGGELPFVSYQHGSGTDEVLRPTLMTVSDGRSYRKMTEVDFGPKRKEVGAATGPSNSIKLDERHPVRPFNDDVYDEGEDLSEELKGVELTRGGGFLFRMDIPEVFYKYIIGRQGRTKTTIEKDTGCRIRIPGRGKAGNVTIEGQSERSVAEAKRRLEMITWSNRLRERITHFISIPLNLPALKESLATFHKEVMANYSKDEGICDDVFQIPEKLHITVGVMRLFSREEEEKAVKVMKECLKRSVIHLGSEPAVIKVQGLDCMNDDHSSASVLFAKLCLTDSSDRLQKFVDSITSNFREMAPDLMTKEFGRDSVKLHATVMNANFVDHDMESRETGPRNAKKYKINATNVFKEFGEFEFGELPLEVLHISKRGEYDTDGFYKCIESFDLHNFLT